LLHTRRSFRGTLTDADGEEREWLGTRVTQASGEEPPLRQRWVYEALLGRGHARLALKQPAEALEDAREATRLCCRTAEGWQLLAEAAEACGDGEAAAAARGEAAQLAG
jgi:predicted Zn-dependent protease